MGLAGKEIVRSAVEAVRGQAGSSWVQHDLHGEGLRIQESASAFEGHFSSTWPTMSRVIRTGRRGEGQLVTPFTAAQAQTLLEMGYKRTAGVLDSFTFGKLKTNTEQTLYTGCVCDTLTIRWGRGDEPVIATFDWRCLLAAATSGIVAGSYPSGALMMGHKTVVTVNGQAFQDLDGELTIANNLIVGPNGTTGWPLFIKDGAQRIGVRLRHPLESNAISELMRGSAGTPVVIAFKTGTGTQAATFTLPLVHILEAPEEAGDQGADVEQPVTGVLEGAMSVAYQTT